MTSPTPAASPRPGLLGFEGHWPDLAADVFVAPGALVIGRVTLGAGSSVWFNSVLRGDGNFIRVGARTNIQDLSMVHIASGRTPTIIGDDVTVGHRALLHACEIGDSCLIGMGAIIQDRAVVEPFCLIGAGALVTEGTRIPTGTLALGAPARVKRDLTEGERAMITRSALDYAALAQRFRSSLTTTPPPHTEP